jgi:site-specific recombinase XerD
MNALAVVLQKYFTDYGRAQRDLSENTLVSYRDTWRLLIKHLADVKRVHASDIDLGDVDAEHVRGFLDHLQTVRGNSVRTRNTRLGAIRVVLAFASPDHPEHAATISRVLAIPPKKHPTPVLEFLTKAETDALLDAPDRATWTGRRDHALLALAAQTGLRVSELRSLRTEDVDLGSAPAVRCTGKGRKHRVTPLTAATKHIMAAYAAERAGRPGDALFCGPRGAPLTSDALEHRLTKHIATATMALPALAGRRITMHTLRHTAAMALLEAGVDVSVIALWLGHAHTRSTDIYLHASMTLKQAAANRIRPPDSKPGVYQPEPDILAWLNNL